METRREELIKGIQGPLEKFFEEHMAIHLRDISNTPLLAQVLLTRVDQGDTT